jgi:threonyl-tRNA synthetase
MRHSAAHVMATAVRRIFGTEVQLDIGPPTDDGFYYDFDLKHRLTPEDLAKIEAEMAKIIAEDQKFERTEVSREEATRIIQDMGQRYKIERLADIPEGEAITFYKNGEFVDLCRGPHVFSTGRIKAFKLTHLASAYYRGDSNKPQLQRIYGTAFKNKTELEAHFTMLEEAKRRDHRKLGTEMGLYAMDAEYTGPGLPLWLPKGTAMVEELEKLAKETEFAAGYVRVRTPHLAKEKMYTTSGHLPYYADSMYPPMELHEHGHGKDDDAAGPEAGVERYYLKAMNCPHHHRIFAAEPRSYRDLPLRLAEYGTCYRYEESGTLFGLMRVRSLNMNDAHIYCTEEQFADEFRAVNDMYLKYFKIFGLEKYQMRFSTHGAEGLGKKYVDEPALWKKTEDMVRKVLVESGINFVEVANEAAFYGPKIDVQVWSAIGREFTIATNQVDFAVPVKFGLVNKDRDNTEKTPLCIHRAPLGTHERFIGFLIEHYAGNFPLWLAPEQVRVLTLGDEAPLVEYAQGILNELRGHFVRAEGDFSSTKINGKIQDAEKARVHTMLVIGARDMQAGAVSVRVHGKGNLGAQPRAEAVARIVQSIQERRADVK